VLMDARKQRLGEHANAYTPPWAVNALGPVPEHQAARLGWQRRAAAIAAWRELSGYHNPADPIGPEPAAAAPDLRAAWHEALAALGPADGPDMRGMPDGMLLHLRDTHPVDTAWAPQYVGDEFRQVRDAAWDARLTSLPEPRPRPPADVPDEEPLTCREPLRVKDRRVLLEPQRLIRQPVHANDHRGRQAGRLEGPAPPRHSPAVAGEHDRPGRIRRDVHRDLPATVVAERLGDKLSGCRAGKRRFRPSSGTARAVGCAVIHCRAPSSDSRHLDRSRARETPAGHPTPPPCPACGGQPRECLGDRPGGSGGLDHLVDGRLGCLGLAGALVG
jgi:hypothetical protein